MSVEGQVLGAATVTGTGATVISSLSDTGTPQLIGIMAAAVTIIVLGIVARFAKQQ